MQRRTFVHTLGSALATAPFTTLLRGHAHLSRIGLELFSVRDQMAQDPERTLAAVAAMGYRDVELLWSFGNFRRTPAQVRATLDKEGLRAPSAHVSAEVVLVGWERSLAIAHQLGQEYIIVPSFSPDTSRSLDDWREWADRFNAAGAVARRAGIWLAFHNEPDHMAPIEGKVPYDVFVERTDPSVVRHQLDVGNMVMGGGVRSRISRATATAIGASTSRMSSRTGRPTPSSARARWTSASCSPGFRTSTTSRATSSRRERRIRWRVLG